MRRKRHTFRILQLLLLIVLVLIHRKNFFCWPIDDGTLLFVPETRANLNFISSKERKNPNRIDRNKVAYVLLAIECDGTTTNVMNRFE